MEPGHLLHSAITCPSSGNARHLQSRPICRPAHRTTTQQLIWRQQQKCGALGASQMESRVVGQHYETPHFHPRHRHPPFLEWPYQKQPGAGLWPLLRPVSVAQENRSWTMLSFATWNAWSVGSGWPHNGMAAQYLPRDLVRPSSGLSKQDQTTIKQTILSFLASTGFRSCHFMSFTRFQWLFICHRPPRPSKHRCCCDHRFFMSLLRIKSFGIGGG